MPYAIYMRGVVVGDDDGGPILPAALNVGEMKKGFRRGSCNRYSTRYSKAFQPPGLYMPTKVLYFVQFLNKSTTDSINNNIPSPWKCDGSMGLKPLDHHGPTLSVGQLLPTHLSPMCIRYELYTCAAVHIDFSCHREPMFTGR